MKRHLKLLHILGLLAAFLPFLLQCGSASDGTSQSTAKTALTGEISNLDTEAKLFELGGQEVDFSAAGFEGGTEDDLADGEDVEVEGSLAEGEVIEAEAVKFEDNNDVEAGKIKIKADVDAVDSEMGTITLRGLQPLIFKADAATKLVSFNSLAELASGDHIKIKAIMDGFSGQLTATEIKLMNMLPKGKISIKAEIEEIDMTAGTLKVAGVSIDFAQIESFFLERGIAVDVAAVLGGASAGDEISIKGSINLSTGAVTLEEIKVKNEGIL
ncbi:MAG: hypothetical protein HYY43_06865 [Deltaproteobacteria bacterium]|nr:hypothetical protein [Deltaproteobacteria bacterium]